MAARYFIALPISLSIRSRLADYAQQLKRCANPVKARWVDPQNYHITLCFIGDLSQAQLLQLQQRMADGLASVSAFKLRLDGCERFRVNKRLNVVAARVEAHPQLTDLSLCLHTWVRQLDHAGKTLTVQAEQFSFRPHITLARLPASVDGLIEQAPALASGLLLPATTVVLYQSRLSDQGATYTPVFEAPLLTVE